MSLGLDKIAGNLTHTIELSQRTQITLIAVAVAYALSNLLKGRA
jgi:hypothetical protein